MRGSLLTSAPGERQRGSKPEQVARSGRVGGRPRWPIFTGMFAAAYAGKPIGGGDMSAFGRLAPTGHHYLVGSMFVRYLAEKYGERRRVIQTLSVCGAGSVVERRRCRNPALAYGPQAPGDWPRKSTDE